MISTPLLPKVKLPLLFICFVSIMVAVLFYSVVHSPQRADALSGAEFSPGRIIDDGIFYNKDAMNAAQIQHFLNAKVPTCNTNHLRSSDSDDSGPPYTCLKDYRQDTTNIAPDSGLCNGYIGASSESASQIIYNVAQSCGINPQVILVMLQKEQGLVTDTWPWEIQYRKAMGAFCPDTAPCNPAYAGFFYQVYYGAHRFKVYAANPNSYNYKAGRNNYILYNPNTACGGSTVFIENQATASLYIYTPYQPNPATLAVGLGIEAPCGAYGNKNFWWYFNIWFGSTRAGEHFWRVIRTADDGRLFLQVGNTKRWIPTGEIYTDWTLDNFQIDVLSQSEFDLIPTIPELTRLGTTGQYNYVVENGRKHYLPPSLEATWNFQSTIAAPVGGLLRIIPENEPMGRFIKAEDGSYWIMNGTQRHPINQTDLSAWGYANNNVVGIANAYLNAIPIGAQVSRHISSSGTKYVVDQASLIRMQDSAYSQTWETDPYVPIDPIASSSLPIRTNASWLVRAFDSPHWFVLIDGKRYYVPNGNIAANWGLSGTNLLLIDPLLLSQFTFGGNLTNFAKDTTSQNVYIMDGQRHHVASNALLSTLTVNPSEIIDVSSTRIAKIPEGSTYTKPLVLVTNTPHLYLLDKGKKYHVSSGALSGSYNAWGGFQQLSSSLIDTIPTASTALKSIFRDSLNNYYLSDNGKKYQIDSDFEDSWAAPDNPEFSNDVISLIPTASTAIETNYVKFAGETFVMNQGKKSKINSGLINSYVGSETAFALVNNTIVSGTDASYLVRSTNDQKVWFINQDSKTEVNFAKQVSLGYLSRGLQIPEVSSSFLSSIPTSSSSSLLIRKQGSWGIKFVNFGHSLGFPDGTTLNSIVSSDNPILVVDDWTYDQFPLAGSVSRIVKDDTGKLYLLENGLRRWITNGTAYLPYQNIPITYLYGTTLAQIPVGSPIN